MTRLSVLDLCPVPQGSTPSQALANTLKLAQACEAAGYQRYWLAEHHNMMGIASAATSVVIGHVAGGTKTIRVGAGGIMLTNHAPLVIAEQFGTLAALFPGRIDLGVGRAPGTDQITAHALRRNLNQNIDEFPQDVMELMAYFAEPVPGQKIRAVPGAGQNVPVWILGSSTYGAQLAAHLGLPYAFASHFAPAYMEHAIALYRKNFRPSEHLAAPHVMVGLNVFAAATDAEAKTLYSSLLQAFINLRLGRPAQLPPPIEGFEDTLDEGTIAALNQTLSCSVVGGPETVREGIAAFIARTGADEIMVTGQIFDPVARIKSFEIAASVHQGIKLAA